MRSTVFALLSLLGLEFLPSVAAHGYVSNVAIDGTSYKGNVPNQTPSDSPIRLIDDISPVKGSSNPNLSCGQGAALAAIVAPANPGSSVSFSWVSGGGGNWPHNTGPIMTYMAACEGTTCDKFNSSGAKWFKIDEAGQRGSGWVQADIMNGKPYTLTLPNNILPGDYLIRHELIALQIAVSLGGAEFYPSCTQVHIGGNGNGAPNATVSFPGAYSDTDPGILTPDVYNPGFTYVFPGPPIAAFVTAAESGSSNTSSSGSSSPASSASEAASPSSTTGGVPASTAGGYPPSSGSSAASASSSTAGACTLVHGAAHFRRDNGYWPRRLRRVMRQLGQE